MTVDLGTPLTSSVWMEYALKRIRTLVDKPRELMTDAEVEIYTFATAALSASDPIVPDRDGRLCRVCRSRWGLREPAAHAAGCPVVHATYYWDSSE
jgi:hypothetical protein